jgi:Tfp pilus assembly protein PilN/ribosomal protein L7Ae-like RNA K-turn-binding protein
MSSLGIYFGAKDINLIEVSGRKILNNVCLPHPSTVMAELEEKVPADIKLIALLKDAFRTYRIKADEAAICISGQDLVIRTFEIPLIPQSELKGVISFEVKKYIPFKLEELDYDYQILFNSKNKTSLVLFVGIKKEILNNYLSIFKQLNLKIRVFEYSAFSILRLLKIGGINDVGVKAVLCFDLNNEDEANFSVFENGFSLFSRDFMLTQEPAGFEQVVEADRIQKLEKLKNEIKISLDYYKRKFPEKALKDISLVSDKESHQQLTAFSTEASIPIKFVETQKILGKSATYSSVLIKSFAASLFKVIPLKIKINLVGAKLKTAKVVAGLGKQPSALLEGLKLDFRYIILGIIIYAAVFGYGLMRIKPVKEEINSIINQRVKVNSPVEGNSIDELSELGSRYTKKINNLDNLIKNQKYVTYPLDAIPRALPNGVWLSSFNFNQKGPTGMELILNGRVYLADNEKEVEAVNVFLLNLKKDPVFSKNFKEININSIDRSIIEEKNVLVFTIVCRNISEK